MRQILIDVFMSIAVLSLLFAGFCAVRLITGYNQTTELLMVGSLFLAAAASGLSVSIAFLSRLRI